CVIYPTIVPVDLPRPITGSWKWVDVFVCFF
ncbi:MAG: hypothetical protein ACI9QV_001495, partial [Methylophagaceae bacterium]